MNSSTVGDVFSEGFRSVREDDTLSSCLTLLKEKMPPVLVVTDNEGKYKGVLARRWVMRSKLDPSTTKVGTLMRPAPSVTLHDSLSKVARLMIESDARQIPVYSGEKLLGFVTDEDVIHGVVTEKWGDTRVEEIMTKRPSVVDEDDSIGEVISLFREKGISHAPVISNGKLVGMISTHDIIEHTFQRRQRQTVGERIGEKIPVLSLHVKDTMTKSVITASPGTKLKNAAKKMHKYDISSLVIVRNRKPIGIITKRDFLEPIAQMEEVSRRLTLRFSVKDVEIDEPQRDYIIEDFKSFAGRYEETLGAGTLFVYMKTHGSNYKGDQLIHCRLQLRTRKGSFFSSSEAWGVVQTFSMALDRLDKQILRSKEVEYEPEFTRAYLRRIDFPLRDL